ncbi:MAG: hypothetical protein NUV68_05910 [Caldiserica bacterium]|nr:hypothetical protein [Caldisericota bacterium]MDH7562860.1 hypothetical protein [Caldisericota bacterium]
MPRFSELMREERRQRAEGGERPSPAPSEGTEKIIAFLYQHQVRWIDQIAKECKARGGKQLWRGEIIRGLIEGLMGQHLDLTGVQDERDLALRVQDLLISK